MFSSIFPKASFLLIYLDASKCFRSPRVTYIWYLLPFSSPFFLRTSLIVFLSIVHSSRLSFEQHDLQGFSKHICALHLWLGD